MTEPTTPTIGLIVPNTGDLTGAWGTAAINTNMTQLDGLFGGQTFLSISGGTTITLSTSGASVTPSSGPNQSSNAAIYITGSPTANSKIVLTVPGVYRFYNQMGFSQFSLQIAPVNGTGAVVCAPPSEFRRIFFDGTNCYYMDMPHMGSLMNMCVSTTPAWINACTTPPWLPCLGGIFSASTFPNLNSMLGATFGGNGISNFGVPDFQSRVFLMLDVQGVGRVTSGISGIAGNTIAASGGAEELQQHTHANTLSDPQHVHGFAGGTIPTFNSGAEWSNTGPPRNSSISQTDPASTGISINNAASGSGNAQNMPPALVGGITFIKT